METALRECCQGIKLGKILVHRWGGTALTSDRKPTEMIKQASLTAEHQKTTQNHPEDQPQLTATNRNQLTPTQRHGCGVSQEEVVYARLPADIARRHVLLLDPVLGTGHTACRAVQVGRVIWGRGRGVGGLKRRRPNCMLAIQLTARNQFNQCKNYHLVTNQPITSPPTSKVLLDRGVAEERILFLCVIAAPEAVHKVWGCLV